MLKDENLSYYDISCFGVMKVYIEILKRCFHFFEY